MKDHWKLFCIALVLLVAFWFNLALTSRPEKVIFVDLQNGDNVETFEFGNPVDNYKPHGKPAPPKPHKNKLAASQSDDCCNSVSSLSCFWPMNGSCCYQVAFSDIESNAASYVSKCLLSIQGGTCKNQISSSCSKELDLKVTISNSVFENDELPSDFLSEVVQCNQDDSDVSQCLNIEELYISDSNLQVLSNTALQSLPSLSYLFLQGNNIEEIPSGFFDTSANLVILELISNPLTSMGADVFNPLKSLTNFIFDGTSLSAENFKKALTTPLEQVQTFSWQNAPTAPLTNLTDGTFQYVPGLVGLYLTGSQIENIEVNSFKGLSSVQQLYLDQNNLKTLPYNVFEGMSALTSALYLSDNLWNCTCQLQWLKTYINIHGAPVPNCQTPNTESFDSNNFCSGLISTTVPTTITQVAETTTEVVTTVADPASSESFGLK